ncbi:hypothetical protein A6R68_23851 [Neotoma lepida]|uniref:Uncharacterized protein n=1 Tax=Neotoma lepida TaxID=56216 RepID=A0A1A6HVA7_NEOLE|nr:hypothetical protein A6R68_23851 [Neotoma lepida]
MDLNQLLAMSYEQLMHLDSSHLRKLGSSTPYLGQEGGAAHREAPGGKDSPRNTIILPQMGTALNHASLQTRTGAAGALTNHDLTALHGRASWQQAMHHKPLSIRLLPTPSPTPLGLVDDSHQHFQEFELLPGFNDR